MRHLPAVLVLSLAAGCGQAVLPTLPTVTGAIGQRPTLTVPEVAPPTGPQVHVLAEGAGPVIGPGQVVVTDAEIRIWRGNKPYLNTYESKQPTTVILDGQHVSQTWATALLGRKAGSRVMLISPATQGFGPNGVAPAQVSPTDTLVIVFDVIGGYAPRARVGVPDVVEAAQGMPKVEADPARPPVASDFPRRPPNEPRVSVLKQGTGAEIKPGSTLVVQYLAMPWGSDDVIDASYARGGPTGVNLVERAVPPGWVQALAGQRVGSRVLLAVPKSPSRFPLKEAGVYVIDVLTLAR